VQYETNHPGIDIRLNQVSPEELEDLLPAMEAAGQGGPSIIVVDEAYISEFVSMSDSLVNLADFGALDYQEQYLPWKWSQATNADGTVVVGLGGDVGGLALCYRQDLFGPAGLPVDRDAVSAALGDSWQDFIAFGEEYVAAMDRPFVGNATDVYNAALTQLGTGYAYYDLNNDLDMDNIKPAFDIALEVIEAGLSANLVTYSSAWSDGLLNGDFAVVACPSWMTDYIRTVFPANAPNGQWDIADIPGAGGNWGGSFYTIPNQDSEDLQAEAWDFLEWLIQPEQQIKIMNETGSLPSQIAILESDEVSTLTNEFFNNAPYGEIYARSVLDIPAAIYYAPGTNAVHTAVENVLNEVQAGLITIDDAWDAAVAAAEMT
jgi:cellobiose transport system substrate-binding protein